ncbi:DUF6624 domain-containing protein [Massilia suwonensis]|uniref:DUF6624 domain-containing protein n=1 Tax=Massilia suwonensis TaxID=648895 RepID=A0ABW0MKR3_9BURK
MRSTLHLLVPLFAAAAMSPALAAPSCAAYGGELAAMVEAADTLRSQVDYLAAPSDAAASQRRAALEEVERTNAERLNAWMTSCGWPRRSVEGVQAARAAWLIAQQRSTDVGFQRQVVRQLELAVLDGEASPMHLAAAADRLAVQEGRPQRYGTQLRQVAGCGWDYYLLDDLARVEARRKRLGLPSLEEHKRAINAMVTVERCTSPLSDALSNAQ